MEINSPNPTTSALSLCLSPTVISQHLSYPTTTLLRPHLVITSQLQMSGFMRKKLYLCFSKIKCLPPPHDLQDSPSSPSSTPTSVLLRSTSSAASTSSSSFDDPDFLSSLPDLSTLYASRRFFFSSPGLSNSIVESSSEDAVGPSPVLPTAGGVAVSKYSPDPRGDFRRSMQEMVEAKEARDVKEDWEYLHELLLCYLRLNPKHTHRFIIGAFTDLIVSLMSQSRLDKDETSTSTSSTWA